ncbi:MAG: ornithine--oxo-acid transaminase [Proteobacteria bacterium]|nr:ornithine--oxo-acid transaminase [Pseudomonadota bacterium]
MTTRAQAIIARTEAHGAHNYDPLPVVLTRGEGVWVWDVEGRRYLDLLSGYSALSFGHAHPRLVAALAEQAARLSLTSRAFYNDRLPELFERLTALSGLPRVLPMNTGAEAVETALKAARKWGYTVKGVPPDSAEILVCTNNFHGRTITVISFSSVEAYRAGFGPLTPGFRAIPFGDAAALRRAIGPQTVAFLVEPIQGEGGIVVPPAGYLTQVAEICRGARVLLVLDEVQTGLGRTGRNFCFEHEGAHPDLLLLGKALGGGLYPVSAVVGTEEVMGVFGPGDHGSTFGGNPLAAAVGVAALDLLEREQLAERARVLGDRLLARLAALASPLVAEVRGRGLLVGVVLKPELGGARPYCERLLAEGLLCKETHRDVIRLAPPLIISEEELDWAVDRLGRVLC